MPTLRSDVRLGLRENLGQFSLLVVVNAFVGAMVGLERTILSPLAEQEFGLVARTAVLSFIVVFGIVKAITNYMAGRLSDRMGRKRVLVVGWVIAVPVPFLLMWGPTWNWILIANVLLGISQGLTWSSTVFMKIDLVGPLRRGLAMGLNEFAGYGAVSIAALLTGYIAARYGLRPEPFYPGIAFAAIGLFLSAVVVQETRGHVQIEVKSGNLEHSKSSLPSQWEIFKRTSLMDRELFSVSQTFPIVLCSRGTFVNRNRLACCHLSSGVGSWAIVHRGSVRPDGTQMAHSRGDVGASCGYWNDRRVESILGFCRWRALVGCGHSYGVSDALGRHR
jgi:MFS family permease